MPDGRPFANAYEFKNLLLDDKDRFLHAFVEHLSTYALRRVLTVDDRKDIDAIVQNAKLKKSKLREVIRAVALSDLLRKR
jgi:hypothetical protein